MTKIPRCQCMSCFTYFLPPSLPPHQPHSPYLQLNFKLKVDQPSKSVRQKKKSTQRQSAKNKTATPESIKTKQMNERRRVCALAFFHCVVINELHWMPEPASNSFFHIVSMLRDHLSAIIDVLYALVHSLVSLYLSRPWYVCFSQSLLITLWVNNKESSMPCTLVKMLYELQIEINSPKAQHRK